MDLKIHWQDSSDYSTGILPESLQNETPINPSLPPDFTWPFQPESHDLEAYCLGDLSAGFTTPDKKLHFTGAIHNLFHSRHREVPGGGKTDTTFSARLTAVF